MRRHHRKAHRHHGVYDLLGHPDHSVTVERQRVGLAVQGELLDVRKIDDGRDAAGRVVDDRETEPLYARDLRHVTSGRFTRDREPHRITLRRAFKSPDADVARIARPVVRVADHDGERRSFIHEPFGVVDLARGPIPAVIAGVVDRTAGSSCPHDVRGRDHGFGVRQDRRRKFRSMLGHPIRRRRSVG